MTYFPSKHRPQADDEIHPYEPRDASLELKPKGAAEIITIAEAVERIAFQACHLSTQDHVSQPAELLVRRAVLQTIRVRGSAKGAQQLSHFYATVITALAEKLTESEYLADTWFSKWREDCHR